MTGALSHLRVCDLSGQLAGAGATKILAAFGAQVIRVEDPVSRGLWDALRGVGPYVDERRGVDLGAGFNNHNAGKYGVTINLRTDEGKQLLRELVAVSENRGDRVCVSRRLRHFPTYVLGWLRMSRM